MTIRESTRSALRPWLHAALVLAPIIAFLFAVPRVLDRFGVTGVTWAPPLETLDSDDVVAGEARQESQFTKGAMP